MARMINSFADVENISLHSVGSVQFRELEHKVIPEVGDFIMYEGLLLEVLDIKHFKQCLIVKFNEKRISLQLRIGYRIFSQRI